MQAIAVAPDEFATDRLNAERLRPDHLGELIEMHQDARIMATLGGSLFERAILHRDKPHVLYRIDVLKNRLRAP